MRRLTLIISILSMVNFASCNLNRSKIPSNNEIEVNFSEGMPICDSVLTLCEGYIKYLENQRQVFQIFFEQKPDSITVLVTNQCFTEFLYLDKVFGYFKIRDNIFLLYFGQYPFIETSNTFKERLKGEIKEKDVYSIRSSRHSSFDYGFLEIKISQETGFIKKRFVQNNRYGFKAPPPPTIIELQE